MVGSGNRPLFFSAEQGDHHRQIYTANERRQISNVGHPFLVRILGLEVLSEIVRRIHLFDAFRWGLKDIFIWTTAIAILLGVGRIAIRFVNSDKFSPGRISLILLNFGLALSMSMAIAVNIWAMLEN